MSSAVWTTMAVAWIACGQVQDSGETATDEIGVKLELKRQLVRVAAKDGVTVIAIEMRVGRYARDTDVEKVRENCAGLPEARRYQHPECLVIEQFDSRYAGDFKTMGMLYEDGYSREKALSRVSGAGFAESMRNLPPTRLRFASVATWDEYLCITHVLVSKESTFPWTVFLKRVGERLWMTEELGFGHIVGSFIGNYLGKHTDTLDTPPADAVAFGISVDSQSPFEKHRLTVRRHDRNAQRDPDALVLYIRRVAEPKVRSLFKGAKQALAYSDATLRDALLPYLSSTPTVEQLVDKWAPDVQDNVRANLLELQRCEQRFGLLLQLGKRLEDLAIVARVETDGGEVCYVRSLDKDGKARIRSIVRTTVNGELKLDYRLPNGNLSQILTNQDIATAIAGTDAPEP